MRAWFDGLSVPFAALAGRFRRDERAITALEYGIIASALAFVLIAAFTKLGTPLSTIFSNVGADL